MVTEHFINSCFTVILNENVKVKRNKRLFRDILEIIEFYEKRKIEVPIEIKNKYDCLVKVCQLKIEEKTTENIIESVTFSEKFKQLKDFLVQKKTEMIEESLVADDIKQIRSRKRLNNLMSNYNRLKGFVDNFGDGTFDSIEDFIKEGEGVVRELYSSMMESQRVIEVEATASLDFKKDDYSSVLETIQKRYQKKNTTPTGYRIFDNEVFNNGGFEPGRIYIFGGGAGSGKSTFLNNIILNAAIDDKSFYIGNNEKKKSKNTFVYVTLENTIDEAFIRTYMPMYNKTIRDVLNDITNNVDIKKNMVNELNKNNSTIVMKYFPARSISSIDIAAVLDEAIEEYGKESIRGLYVDYLSLLTTDFSTVSRKSEYRHVLGDIVISLKNLAVAYNIPVITVTQLRRDVYKVATAHDLNLDLTGESIQIVENSDFFALMAQGQMRDDIVYMSVGKNRSGKSKIFLEFKVSFDMYKFINGFKVTNSGKEQSVTTNEVGVPKDSMFGGFDSF